MLRMGLFGIASSVIVCVLIAFLISPVFCGGSGALACVLCCLFLVLRKNCPFSMYPFLWTSRLFVFGMYLLAGCPFHWRSFSPCNVLWIMSLYSALDLSTVSAHLICPCSLFLVCLVRELSCFCDSARNLFSFGLRLRSCLCS